MTLQRTIALPVLAALLFIGSPADASPRSRALRLRLHALQQLEQARADALTLIRDTTRYVKGDQAAQRKVTGLTQQVARRYEGVARLLDRDARALVRKKSRLEALRAKTDKNAWEQALLSRLRDHAALRANRELFRTLRGAERPSAHQVEQVRLTNAYRMQLGLPALRFDPKLARAAQGHSSEMLRLRYFAHESPTPGQESPGLRARSAGFQGLVGENIATGYRSPRAVHRGWLHSPPHHRNILDPSWERMGVAFAGKLWTQVFGRIPTNS